MKGRDYKVPSKDYGVQYREILPQVLEEIERVLLDEDPILGRPVERFEEEFARWCGTDFAVGVGSGTDALYLALRGLGIGPGDEVVTSGNTFFATLTAILMTGAVPVLADPDPETMNLSPRGLLEALTPRTRAVLPVHLYGLLSPVAEIREICEEKGLLLVEDAAQAHGARGPGGRRAGAWGAAGCFSFHPSKNLGAFGDGGLVATSDPGLAGLLRELRNLGKKNKYEVRHVAPNSKLDSLQAAILSVKLRRVDAWNARRREIASYYRRELNGEGDLVLPFDPDGEAHVYHLFVVRTSRRDELRAWLKKEGINAGVHYPVPPHLQEMGGKIVLPPGGLPVTEELARTVLSLPVSHELRDDQVEYVCRRIQAFFRDG